MRELRNFELKVDLCLNGGGEIESGVIMTTNEVTTTTTSTTATNLKTTAGS